MKVTLHNQEFNVREFYQYEDIPHNKSCGCDCGHAEFLYRETFDLNGFCQTNSGLMGIFECNKCHQVYRHHVGSTSRHDIEEFKENLATILYRKFLMK